MTRERRRIETLYRQLLDCEPVPFPKPRQRLNAPTYKGVYLILGPRGAVLHVGSTPRAKQGIRQRLHGHLGNRSSFVNIYMDYDGQGNLLRRSSRRHYREYVLNYALMISGMPTVAAIREAEETPGGSIEYHDVRYYVHNIDGTLLMNIEASDETLW